MEFEPQAVLTARAAEGLADGCRDAAVTGDATGGNLQQRAPTSWNGVPHESLQCATAGRSELKNDFRPSLRTPIVSPQLAAASSRSSGGWRCFGWSRERPDGRCRECSSPDCTIRTDAAVPIDGQATPAILNSPGDAAERHEQVVKSSGAGQSGGERSPRRWRIRAGNAWRAPP